MPRALKRLLIIASFAAAPFAVSLFGFGSSNTSAMVLDYGSAVAEINTRCAQGYTLAHATYGSNPSLNMNTGVVTYNFNVLWKRCNNAYTGEYAITGYDGSACPVIGMYHNGWVGTQDCVKYTDRHGEGRAYSTCGSPRCVYPGFNANVRAGGYNGPPNNGAILSKTIGSRTVQIPNWGVVGATSGSANVFLANVCGAHFRAVNSWSDIYCMPSYISVSWVRINYELTPTISVNDNEGVETPTGRTISGTINNRGPTPSRSNKEWRITQVIYDAGESIPRRGGGTSASGVSPCAFYTGSPCDDTSGRGVRASGYGVGNTTESAFLNIGEYPVGTQICFGLSVRQYTHNLEDWRHSPLRCLIAGKKPKVNVLGGDLYVGRSLAGIASPTNSRIITSQTTNAVGTFAAWGEYALVSRGPVQNMRSGAGTVDGIATNINLLTFANAGHTAATCNPTLGCYSHGGSLANTASRFKTSSSTPLFSGGSLSGVSSGIYTGSGTITIGASTIGAGRSIIINAPSANVVINGDITYASGPYQQVTQIPQVVIIANNITINEGVQNVDSWLVAPGTISGSTVTGGVIRTCNRVPSEISVDVCSGKLTINGPVIANRLIMLRTGGAEPRERAGDPAEVFNLRSDAYLWALGQSEANGRVTTVYTKELPPRY